MPDFFSSFHFLEPRWLFLFLAFIPLIVLGKKSSRPYALTFPSLRVLTSLGQKVREKPARPLASLLLLFALIPAIFALARPSLGRQESTREASGIDIIIAIDVSASMDTPDFSIETAYSRHDETRLQVSKQIIADFIKMRPNDRIGLLAFATQPYAIAPLTLQHPHLVNELENLRSERSENARTAIGTAIAAAAKRLDQRQESKSKLLILVTDGDNNAGALSPHQAAELAATLGIKIYPVSILKSDAPNSPELEEIARLSGGLYHRANSTSSLAQAFQAIDQLEKSSAQVHTLNHEKPLHLYFLLASFSLLLPALILLSLNPAPMP